MPFENKYRIYFNGDTVDLPGRITATVECESDIGGMGAPWEEHDGHIAGIRDASRGYDGHVIKGPGERILFDGGRHCLLVYDFAESVRIAKRDGWDTEPYGQGTKGERAVRAVLADEKNCRGYASGDWYWCGVIVTLTDADGHEISTASVWGIESCDDWWKECATEMIDSLHADAMEDKREAWREALTNARFAKSEPIEIAYWNSRDVRTVRA